MATVPVEDIADEEAGMRFIVVLAITFMCDGLIKACVHEIAGTFGVSLARLAALEGDAIRGAFAYRYHFFRLRRLSSFRDGVF